MLFDMTCTLYLTLEKLSGMGVKIDTPLDFFFVSNFCCLTDFQKLWYNCSMFVSTSFDAIYVT